MGETVKFITAESAVESEPLFRSMSHEELVQNCIAAQKLIGMQIARAEFHKERAEIVTRLCLELERYARRSFSAMEICAKFLNKAATDLSSRPFRKLRAEAYAAARSHLNEIISFPIPPIEMPAGEPYTITHNCIRRCDCCVWTCPVSH